MAKRKPPTRGSLIRENARLRRENALLNRRVLELETAKGVLEREATDRKSKARNHGWGFNG